MLAHAHKLNEKYEREKPHVDDDDDEKKSLSGCSYLKTFTSKICIVT